MKALNISYYLPVRKEKMYKKELTKKLVSSFLYILQIIFIFIIL